MNITIEKIKLYYEKFIKLPIQYKIFTSILISLFLHLSFSMLFYIGLYHYTSKYGIAYQAINNINFTLLTLPFYFDILNTLFGMILITIVIIYTFIIIEFRFQIKSKSRYSFSYLYKKMYKSMKNDQGLNRFSKNYIILFMNTVVIMAFLLVLSIAGLIFSFNISFGLFVRIFIPFLVSYYIFTNINHITFKILLIIFIFFIIISSLNSMRADGIKEYLTKSSMGGEIPLSLNVKDKFIDGFLVLLTDQKVYFLNQEKSILTVINRKNVFKMNYFFKSVSKDYNSSLLTPGTINAISKSSKFEKESYVIDGAYAARGNKKLDFSKLHY